MHEISLVDALFDQVDAAVRPHPGAVLCLVRVRIGALAGVEPELFRTAFEGLREPRHHGRAELELTAEPAEWHCATCDLAGAAGEPLRCPTCGGALALRRGDGIYLDHLELEVSDV